MNLNCKCKTIFNKCVYCNNNENNENNLNNCWTNNYYYFY